MADYYPLIARAVAGLDKNSGDTRRALYERARTALLAQLRSTSPALEESDITRERLALEEAIRKVEAESARRARETPPAQSAPSRPPAAQPAKTPSGAKPMESSASQPKRPDTGPAAAAPSAPTAPQMPVAGTQKPGDEGSRSRPSLSNEALKGFRDNVGPVQGDRPDARPRPPQPPQSSKPPPPRDPLAGHPAAHEFDRLEDRLDPQALRGSAGRPTPSAFDEIGLQRPDPAAGSRRGRPSFDERLETERAARRSQFPLGAIIKTAVAVLLIVALGSLVYWQRGTLENLYASWRGQDAQVTRDSAPSRPKISDRIGSQTPQSQAQQQSQVPAVAQRVVLYEEEPSDPAGKRYIGSAIWRTETVSSGAGQPPELAVRADIEIPERKIAVTFSIRRNVDQTLPASHTIEIIFNLPQDFSGGGISTVPGLLMKEAEQTRGAPLAGLGVRVTDNFFLIGLSAVESDFQRNVQLMKERGWFDIPVVYKNNRRAILAIEKGTPGERAFAEAFAAWKQ